MKKLLILLLLPLLAFAGAHKFYVSLTDIAYDQETKALQIISRLFTDDTEKLLRERYNEAVFLSAEEEHEQVDEYLERYLEEKFRISVNGIPREVNYLGKEYKTDKIVLYLEVTNVEAVEEITVAKVKNVSGVDRTVANTLLSDLFPEQKNVVKVEVGDKIKSLLLGSFKEQGSLFFGK